MNATTPKQQARVDPSHWLSDHLCAGPKLERRLKQHAARAGITAIELKAAAVSLGVLTIGDGALSFWRLPIRPQ